MWQRRIKRIAQKLKTDYIIQLKKNEIRVTLKCWKSANYVWERFTDYVTSANHYNITMHQLFNLIVVQKQQNVILTLWYGLAPATVFVNPTEYSNLLCVTVTEFVVGNCLSRTVVYIVGCINQQLCAFACPSRFLYWSPNRASSTSLVNWWGFMWLWPKHTISLVNEWIVIYCTVANVHGERNILILLGSHCGRPFVALLIIECKIKNVV